MMNELYDALRVINCSICLSKYENPSTLPCSHTFCRECIDKAIETKEQCPICTSKFKYHQIRSENYLHDIINTFYELVDNLKSKMIKASSVVNVNVTEKKEKARSNSNVLDTISIQEAKIKFKPGEVVTILPRTWPGNKLKINLYLLIML
jgi:hypothetical protein